MRWIALVAAILFVGCMDDEDGPVLSGTYQTIEAYPDGDTLLVQFDFGPGSALRSRSWGVDRIGSECLLIDAQAKWSLSGNRLSFSAIKGRDRDVCSDELSGYSEVPDITHSIRNITDTSFELKADRDSVWGLFRRP